MMVTIALPVITRANDELLALQKDDTQWALPGKDYAGTRYSTLDQINTWNLSQENLIDYLKKVNICPYHYCKYASNKVNLLICNYKYILSP